LLFISFRSNSNLPCPCSRGRVFRRRTTARLEVALVFRITTEVGTIRALLYLRSADVIRAFEKFTVVVRITDNLRTIRACLQFIWAKRTLPSPLIFAPVPSVCGKIPFSVRTASCLARVAVRAICRRTAARCYQDHD